MDATKRSNTANDMASKIMTQSKYIVWIPRKSVVLIYFKRKLIYI